MGFEDDLDSDFDSDSGMEAALDVPVSCSPGSLEIHIDCRELAEGP